MNAIINGHRGITPDTALRLTRVFGTSPDYWLNLQQMTDLYDAMHSEDAKKIQKLEPISA